MSQIEFHISTPFVGAEETEIVDCPDGWDDMTEAEQTAWADDELQVRVDNFLESGWNLLDDEEAGRG